jgi:soluble lytic murein transglycosylase
MAGYPDDGRLPQAALMAARAYQAANECERAIPYYRLYLDAETTLDDVVYEWLGDCHASLAGASAGQDGELENALGAYRQALQAARDRSVQVGLREKIAGIHLAREEYDLALEEYDAILVVARIEGYRARIEYLAGQALQAAGRVEEAVARYRRAVDRYPEAEYAYLSLIELVAREVPVDEFQRGLVDFYAGQGYPDAYGAAIRAFDRYLAAGEQERADEALYRKALAQRALEQPQEAQETLEALIVGYPESDWLPRAWLEKGATHVWMGDNEAAIQVYRDTAAFFPGAQVAPTALLRAARLREGEGAFEVAARFYEDLQATFPAHEDADEALWRAGLAYYRAGEPEEAAAAWQMLLEKYPRSAYRVKSLYWLGKIEAQPEAEGTGDYWEQLVTSYPRDYYALRVAQVQGGEALTVTRLISTAVEPPAWDVARYEAEILDWLRGWSPVPTATQSIALPDTLARRRDLSRGQALLAVGLRRQALGAFDGTRAAVWDDPLDLARLAAFFREEGLYGLAARCALRLAALWPGGNLYSAPRELQYLAYPLQYADLLSARAREYGLDPLLLAALVRQESLFEAEAESYAGARGLGQVMPATGEGIARTLGMDDFVLDDLYRPVVSIEFAAFYLSVQMGRFDDHILVALAAYNGGPGNTLRWLEATGEGDLDLFVEVITANQSRIYLQTVYEQYLVYEQLYR